jgi:hypothetical protein
VHIAEEKTYEVKWKKGRLGEQTTKRLFLALQKTSNMQDVNLKANKKGC